MDYVQINENDEIEIWDFNAPNEHGVGHFGAWRKPVTAEERIAALEELIVKLMLNLRRLGQ